MHVRVKQQCGGNPVVITLYDGMQFGDLALISAKVKLTSNQKDNPFFGSKKILSLKEMRDIINNKKVIEIQYEEDVKSETIKKRFANLVMDTVKK